MEKHTCKLCFRRFANGRALGGHMRSHVVSAAKPQVSSASSASASSSSSSSSSESEEEEEEEEGEVGGAATYVLRENPKRSYKLVDPEFADAPALSSVDVLDRASDTESPRAPRPAQPRPLSLKRRRTPQAPTPFPDPDPGSSSVSNATTDEHVALSLMMLSRDSWATAPKPCSQTLTEPASAGSDAQAPPPPPPPQRRRRFQCGTCKKVFRSYQALGGHRASHKKSHGWCFPPPPPPLTPPPPPPPPQIHHDAAAAAAEAEKLPNKLHQCPFCFRVFGSGQALGGHKRSHFSSSSSAAAAAAAAAAAVAPPPAAPSPANYAACFDLNLPAPFDDEFELSAISDAEFVAHHHPPN